MSDLEATFLQQIASQPHDWLPRLIFADWLEEQGDPRGELLRLSHELTRLNCQRRPQMEARLQELAAAGVTMPSPSLPNSLNMKLALIPPGQFRMGSPDSDPDRNPDERQVPVTLTRGFWLGQCPVTQAEWKTVMPTTPWVYGEYVKRDPDYPATYVSWEEASEFCLILTERDWNAEILSEGWEYALPTEAQWEYACRAGTESRYSFGDDEARLAEYAWFGRNAFDTGENYAHQAGLMRPNPWGLYDMHGNVREWCRDGYSEQLPGETDPEVQEQARGRVCRGGGWNSYDWICRSASRESAIRRQSDPELGFRVVLVQCDPR